MSRTPSSRPKKIAAVAVALALAISACSGTPDSAEERPSLLRVAITTPLDTIDPSKITNNFLGGVVEHVFEGLTYMTPEREVKPLLATEWEVSEDNLVWTFQLRDDVTFHDGTPFNADAVVANYDRLLDPNNVVPLLPSIGPIADAVAVDEFTVEITTSRPYSGLLAAMSGQYSSFVSPAAIEEYGEDLGNHLPAGTGPYVIESFEAPSTLVLQQNEDYWGEAPATERLEFQSQSDSNGRLASLLSDQVDIDFYVTSDQVERLESDPNYELLTIPSGRMFMIHLPANVPEFDDIRVRQALNLAIDREQIIETVYGGHAAIADSTIGRSLGYQPIGEFEYDPEQAIELLADAGWVKGDDGVLEKDGQKFPTLRFEASDGNYPNDTALAQAVDGYFKEIGLPVELTLEPFSTFFPSSAEKAAKEGWVTQMAWAAPGYDGAAFLMVVYNSPPTGGNNWAGYVNPEVDAQNAKIQSTFDEAERNEEILKGAQLVYDDLPAIYLLSAELLVGVRNGVEGVSLGSSEMHSLRQAHWAD